MRGIGTMNSVNISKVGLGVGLMGITIMGSWGSTFTNVYASSPRTYVEITNGDEWFCPDGRKYNFTTDRCEDVVDPNTDRCVLGVSSLCCEDVVDPNTGKVVDKLCCCLPGGTTCADTRTVENSSNYYVDTFVPNLVQQMYFPEGELTESGPTGDINFHTAVCREHDFRRNNPPTKNSSWPKVNHGQCWSVTGGELHDSDQALKDGNPSIAECSSILPTTTRRLSSPPPLALPPSAPSDRISFVPGPVKYRKKYSWLTMKFGFGDDSLNIGQMKAPKQVRCPLWKASLCCEPVGNTTTEICCCLEGEQCHNSTSQQDVMKDKIQSYTLSGSSRDFDPQCLIREGVCDDSKNLVEKLEIDENGAAIGTGECVCKAEYYDDLSGTVDRCKPCGGIQEDEICQDESRPRFVPHTNVCLMDPHFNGVLYGSDITSLQAYCLPEDSVDLDTDDEILDVAIIDPVPEGIQPVAVAGPNPNEQFIGIASTPSSQVPAIMLDGKGTVEQTSLTTSSTTSSTTSGAEQPSSTSSETRTSNLKIRISELKNKRDKLNDEIAELNRKIADLKTKRAVLNRKWILSKLKDKKNKIKSQKDVVNLRITSLNQKRQEKIKKKTRNEV